jgi:three-Cys-motif partner protein
MAKKQTQSEWMERYLAHLGNESILNSIDIPGLGNLESNPWSILKMAALWSYAYYIYLPIIKKNRYRAIYVDLFSGPGLTIEKSSGRRFIGTAALMATIESTRGGFSKCIYVDSDACYCDALNKRLDALKDADLLTCDEYLVLKGDCNSLVSSVIEQTRGKGSHLLLFVDPFGFNIRFGTLRSFIDSAPPFDMFMNLQVGFIARSTGREATGDFTEDALRLFFPDDRWQGCIEASDMRECLKEMYVDCLFENGGDRIQTIRPIKVSGSRDFYYYLLFTTRKSGSGWLMGIDRIKQMVESFNYRSIQHYLSGGRTLEDF